METRDQRDHRQEIKLAAREHHGRLVSDFEKAQDYHEAARELAAESTGRVPVFTDKEKISLEIYAERQNDPAERDRFLQLALSESHSQEQDVARSQSR
jgi:predicted nucleic acid-binding protein